MDTTTRPEIVHEHPCDHNCACGEPDAMMCDRCEIAAVVRRRHRLEGISDGEVLARLYLSMATVATDASR